MLAGTKSPISCQYIYQEMTTWAPVHYRTHPVAQRFDMSTSLHCSWTLVSPFLHFPAYELKLYTGDWNARKLAFTSSYVHAKAHQDDLIAEEAAEEHVWHMHFQFIYSHLYVTSILDRSPSPAPLYLCLVMRAGKQMSWNSSASAEKSFDRLMISTNSKTYTQNAILLTWMH